MSLEIDIVMLYAAEGILTYILIPSTGGTRTCIHTPGAALAPEEISSSSSDLIDSALKGAALVYFDGRLTEAAMLVASRARWALALDGLLIRATASVI